MSEQTNQKIKQSRPQKQRLPLKRLQGTLVLCWFWQPLWTKHAEAEPKWTQCRTTRLQSSFFPEAARPLSASWTQEIVWIHRKSLSQSGPNNSTLLLNHFEQKWVLCSIQRLWPDFFGKFPEALQKLSYRWPVTASFSWKTQHLTFVFLRK